MLDAVAQEGLASVSRELHQHPDQHFNLNRSAVEVRIFAAWRNLNVDVRRYCQFAHVERAVGCHIHYESRV
jgi:hypothetical protein